MSLGATVKKGTPRVIVCTYLSIILIFIAYVFLSPFINLIPISRLIQVMHLHTLFTFISETVTRASSERKWSLWRLCTREYRKTYFYFLYCNKGFSCKCRYERNIQLTTWRIQRRFKM